MRCDVDARRSVSGAIGYKEPGGGCACACVQGPVGACSDSSIRLPDALRSRKYLARGPAAGMSVSSIAQICRDAVPARVRTTTAYSRLVADRSASTFFLVNASHAVGEGEMNGREITRLGNGSAYANACSRPASVQHPTHTHSACVRARPSFSRNVLAYLWPFLLG